MTGEELDDLRAEAEELGVRVDRRWGAERLREEIAAAQPEPPEPPISAQEIADAEIEDLTGEIGESEPSIVLGPVIRAGGHIDRGDGRGWVVEQDEE